MSPQGYKAFVNLNLEDQMRSLMRGNVKRFCTFSNALRCADKKYGTLLSDEVIKVKHGLYSLYVKQNKKPNALKK